MSEVVSKKLSDVVHELACVALSGEWGRSLFDLRLDVDELDDVEHMSPTREYAECVRLVAEKAPLRIVPGERIVGSATLQSGPFHMLPGYSNQRRGFGGTSHLTPGFDRVLNTGYAELRQRIEDRISVGDLDEKGIDFLESMRLCLDAAKVWHSRHMELLDELIENSQGLDADNYKEVRDNLRNIPENPPTSFREALQSLWFMFVFQRLCGNWPGIGRIDEMLGPYLKDDLIAGRITLEEARELLGHFWAKGAEWTGAKTSFSGSGDAQHYQNIILSGINSKGEDVTNEITYLVLDVVEELGISDFPVSVRVNSSTPMRLLKRIAEVQRYGGGIVSIYNEEVVIDSLVKFGYPLEEARCFTNDGCWEVLIPGKTCFNYAPFDVYSLLQEAIGVTGEGLIPEFRRFEDVYSAFYHKLEKHFIEEFHTLADSFALGGTPSPLMAVLVDDCIGKGRDYWDRGAKYSVYAAHAGGIPDTGNSLVAIKKVVFEEKLVGFEEFIQCLRNDWEGYEDLRQYILNKITFYGNTDVKADAMVKRVLDDFIEINTRIPWRNGVLRPVGVSTFGGTVGWRTRRKTRADGYRDGEVFGGSNFSPVEGTDKYGPTAVIESHCAMELGRIPNGTALELKITPRTLDGENGINALVGLLQGFVRLGGFFLQVDVVDNKTLRDAQKHPEKYRTLAIRVAGWSARFITLSKDFQDMIISRSEQQV